MATLGRRKRSGGDAQEGPREARLRGERNPLKRTLKLLGPGLITGAADDDPSGIGTYSIVGAKIGMPLLWAGVYSIPLMAAVQIMIDRVGEVTGDGLPGVLKRHYPRWLFYPVVLGLVGSNSITAGADIGVMAAAIGLLVPVPHLWFVPAIALALVAMLVFGAYRTIDRYFKWLTLVFFAYVGAACFARPDLGEVLRGTLVPTVRLDREFLSSLVALLGATGSPYLLFWQAEQVVEEEKAMGRRTRRQREGESEAEVRYAKWDVILGMVFSQVIAYFVQVSVAATLFTAGQHDVESAARAAEALRPLAGDAASTLFAIGIIAAGALAVPILTATAAFAVARTVGYRCGLSESWREAKVFYGAIAACALVGAAINFAGFGPMQAAWIASIIFGVLTPPLLVVVLLIANNRRVMGDRTNGGWLNAIGAVALLTNLAAVVGMAATGGG